MHEPLSTQILEFYKSLQPPTKLPRGIKILFPQQHTQILSLVEIVLNKYYNDNHQRRLIFGINPGRFGAGITGINFTAPRQVREKLNIEHELGNGSELSAEFIYEMIEHYGGPEEFYHDYFLTSVCPLGFTRNGLNLNYYDDPKLFKAVKSFIVDSTRQQISMGFLTDVCICIGGEKNLKFFTVLNNEFDFVKEIIPLPHPRFIMQYRRKQKQEYLEEYMRVLKRN